MISVKNIINMCRDARKASRSLALVDRATKDSALKAGACAILKNKDYILNENKIDLADSKRHGASGAFIDRLSLTGARLDSMAESIVSIAALNDPIGETIGAYKNSKGLVIKKVRVPIGVILIIYESRPNVTSDCIALCLKSGNAVILRGGSDAVHSNIAIFNVLNAAAVKHKIPKGAISLIKDTGRLAVDGLLKQSGLIDLVIPRGGESLIKEVTRKSRIPVIKHYKGVCHTYVDEFADLNMAEEICFNAKVQRPGVCNAMETMLVNSRIAGRFLPAMIRRFRNAGVEIRACADTRRIIKGIKAATEDDWYREYLDLVLSVKIVKGVDEAVAHIMKYGSYHSDAIVTEDKTRARKFLSEVDSACVYVNASTRFTDGGQFGKGAEIGISTDKIHARGPMGLEELTSYKYVIYGNGQIRE